MNSEQINRAIAEACGWKWVRNYQWTDANGFNAFSWDIPDYCNDLNAMHEAEELLIGLDCGSYSQKLADVDEAFYGVRATARQRAEAFLRTLGKWEEVTDKESLTVGATAEESSVIQKEVQA